jgi:hypothetical protein
VVRCASPRFPKHSKPKSALENVTLQMFGRAKLVHIDKESTKIVDGAGDKKNIEARIAQIKAQIEETASDYLHATPGALHLRTQDGHFKLRQYVRFDEQKILFKIHLASRAGLTPSPTCPSRARWSPQKRDVAVRQQNGISATRQPSSASNRRRVFK